MAPSMSRLSAEAKEKKHFLNWCQETGLVEVLPYHECDLVTRDKPDYFSCLVRLQVQNVSARYPVFVTGETLMHYIWKFIESHCLFVFGDVLQLARICNYCISNII